MNDKNRYFHILQSLPDAVLLIRASDGVVLDINKAMEKLTGYPRKEIIGRTCEQLSFFPKPGFWTQAFQGLTAKDGVTEIETSIFRKDGNIAHVLVSSRRAEVDGEPCLLNIIRDIRERKQAEDAMRESEQRVRQKLEAVLSPGTDIAQLELGNIIDARMIQSLMDDFYKLTHIPMAIVDLKGEALVGVGWQDICLKFHRVHPETCRHCTESDTQLSAGVKPGEFKRYKCKNNMWDIATPLMVGGRHVGNIFSGQFFFAEEPLDYELFRAQARQYGFDEQAYIAALEAVPHLSKESVDTGMAFLMKLAHMLSHLGYSNIKLARSLAERDALMDSLQKSEQRYHNLFDVVPVGIFRTTPEGRILDANPALVHILGHPDHETLLATNAADIYASPEDRRKWRIRAKNEETIQGFETRMKRYDGEDIWVRISGRITHDEEGRVTYYEGTMEDITERKLAESVLKESEEKFAELFFRSPIPMAITAMKDGRYTEVNEAFAKVMDLNREELIGNTSTGAGFITAEQRALFLAEYRRKGYVENLELQMRVKDGRLRYGLFNSSKVTIRDEDFFLTTVTDITKRKQAEEDLHNAREELVRKEKLAVIGQLAGIVGHEIRNPLGVMNNAVYFLKTVMDDNDTVREYLDIIKQEIDNSQHIVSDLLDFSRTKKPQIVPVAAGTLVSDVLGRCNIPENVSVETDIPGTLPEINVDPFQMGQVLQNLITNAVQAMPEGGTLNISARRETMKEETSGYNPSSTQSDFVEIIIQDTGAGISPENMKNLFQPLFTTKTKGIGLGLVVCKNLTEANGGKIEAESELGKGTTFRLMLPA